MGQTEANVTSITEQGTWRITLGGRVDTSNATEIEAALPIPSDCTNVHIDVEKLEYISSAGLRLLLRIRKRIPDVTILNASSEVYEILDMTGFTDLMNVQKAFKTLSIEGCPVIGKGSNGIVYRTSPDIVAKVYYRGDALPEIKHEREVARKALVLGLPTAISYDIVKVDDKYASVFELLNATSYSKLIRADESKYADYMPEYVRMLKEIHSIEDEDDDFPDIKATVLNWAVFLKKYLPEETWNKLYALIEAVPDDRHLVHGDFNTNNIMDQDGETFLIDMDTLSHGHPIFEFGTLFLCFNGFYELRPEECLDFNGFTAETAAKIWESLLPMYFGTEDPETIALYQQRSQVIGYTRLMRRTIRRFGFEDAYGKAQIELCEKKLIELCNKLDSLV